MKEEQLRKIIREEVTAALTDFYAAKKESSIEGSAMEGEFGIVEAAKWLGLRKPTVYNLVSANKIPYRKRGKTISFDQKELLVWLTRRKHLDIHGTAPNGFNYVTQTQAIYQQPPIYWTEENWD